MILCIDSGNTRIKWGLHDGQQWLASDALSHGDVTQLQRLTTAYPPPAQILLANVAGEAAATNISQQLKRWKKPIFELKTTAQQGGVTNLYKTPERLGIDRWCALIAVRNLFKSACVVVMAGTATTIDTLDNDGNFLGGLILPGCDLMRHALTSGTADLALADGHYAAYPRNTEDAILTGTIEAQVGAIERAFQRLPASRKSCILSGGNAGRLAPHLVIPFIEAQNLPLEGLLTLARENLKA